MENSEHRCVVRLKTAFWKSERGINEQKSLSFLKRKSFGFNILDEDCSNIGASEVMQRIVNIVDCADGVYEVVTCDETREWESGVIYDYNYKLIPFQED